MLKTIRVVVVAALAAAFLTAVSTAPAIAAPVRKGETTISSPWVEIAPLLGIVPTPTGPARMVGDDFIMPVVGNPENGKLMQVGGILLTKPDGTTLSVESTHLDLTTRQVSAVVNGGDRVVMYQATQVDTATVDLYFTPEGAAVLRRFVNFFGIPEDGAFFGTATTTAVVPTP